MYGYTLSLQVLEYQTAILRRDFAAASSLLPQIPKEQRNRIARFLEGLDMKPLALEVSTDQEHRFDLALQLHRLDLAHQIALEVNNEYKWKQLGDYALADWKVIILI